MISKLLSIVKHALLEKSRITYYLNLPNYRRNIATIQKSKKANEKIRVGFMCQEPSIWLSLKPIYEQAVKDVQVEPVLIAVPKMTYAYYIKVTDVDWKETYSFAQQIAQDVVETYEPETGNWKDLRNLDLDYVFLPRPYETYLPKSYRASSLSKYTKVCYVPYGYMTSEDIIDCLYNTHFVRNVYMIFCETTSAYRYAQKKLKSNIDRGIQKIYQIGFPRFDMVQERPRGARGIWKREKSTQRSRVIWTPRWSPDPALGGSNFLKYKDELFAYMEENQGQVDFVFRPHPMTFQAFQEAGLITEKDTKEYIEKYENSDNAVYDKSANYIDTFYQSDILITDDSSVILDYLFTQNPIIYCPAAETLQENPLMECYYIVNSMDELKKVLEELRQGNDPKREYRVSYIKQIKPDYNISQKVLEILKRDKAE